MNQPFSIVPSPDLVRQWALMLEQHTDTEVFTAAVRWGADQELEACCAWVVNTRAYDMTPGALRRARRSKPSLAKRALHILGTHGNLSCAEHDTIRRALEALDD